jgi:hypothetical protein
MSCRTHFRKYCWPLIGCLAAWWAAPAAAAAMDVNAIINSRESCEECHARVTPRLYQEHAEGEHGRIGVVCADCHGTDHRNMPTATARFACEQCHPDETQQFLASDHSRSWENMQASPRYAKQPAAVQRQGCEACHRIGAGENDGRCDFCHTKHSFAGKEAADPAACYTCHMGPDHPQMEAYRTSGHHFTPATCAACHLPAGDHNVNANLDRLSGNYIETQCRQCHDEAFTRQWLQGAALLEEQGRLLLAGARSIISALHDIGRLYPDPRQRAAAAPADGQLVLGEHQLYEDTSRAEKIYFEMHKYLQVHLAQGAYHQDFTMAAYGGLLPLQRSLRELQDEARLLQELATEKVQLTPIRGPAPAADTGDLYRLTYESSFHGVLPDTRRKPDCATCHPDGADRNATAGAAVCATCHTTARAEQFARDLREIKKHAADLRRSGEEIAEQLLQRGVIRKDGTGELQLADDYKQNQGVAEVLLARLRYYLADLAASTGIMITGAAHANPDYAHWYGNAPAKSDLIEIRDAAHKLTRMKKVYRGDSFPPIGPLPPAS